MRGVYNRPWLDLDDLVPLSLLDEEQINIELATSARANNTYGADRPNDFAQHLRPPPDASAAVQTFYKQYARDSQVLQNFAKLAWGVYSPTWVVRATAVVPEFDGYLGDAFQQRVDDARVWQRRQNVFPSVFKLINEGDVFESTGRVIFFITDHYCTIPVHQDYQHPQSGYNIGHHAEAEKEFLWIRQSSKLKDLYIMDESNQQKHRITSQCAWFNTLDLHGGDAVREQSWSLRIDGKFTPKFREKLRAKYL
jgi:hypothetical protein